MACCDVQLGDTGIVFTLSCVDCAGAPVDLTDATLLELYLRPPAGARVTKTAILVTPGTLGKLRYTSVAGDLSQRGTWTMQGHVTWADGRDLKTQSTTFVVA